MINELTGSVPTSLGALSDLEDLYLSENQFSGCVPSELRDVNNNDFEELGLSFCEGEPTPTPEPGGRVRRYDHRRRHHFR